MKGACWFFHHPIHNKSNETWRKRSEDFAAEEFLILERETKLRFSFSSKPNPLSLAATNGVSSKERRLAAELGYGFPIGDPCITDGISPWPFASESVLPSQCPGIHPMHSFRSWNGTLYNYSVEVEKNSPKASKSKRLTIANVRPEKSNRIPNQSYVGLDFSAKRSSLPSLPT
ncbi:hypothetical protein Lal_00019199 [Lupinus albus]|nr:hypothetical protein Lal_00019199 [Lupinus albus]